MLVFHLQTAARGYVSPVMVLTVAHTSTKPRSLLMSIFGVVSARTRRHFFRADTNSWPLTWMYTFIGIRQRRSSYACMTTVPESVATTSLRRAELLIIS